jgi:ubiquinone/menaquinone biosynthesis C-methylase UbiE
MAPLEDFMQQALDKCADGTLSPNMALMQLCLQAPNMEAVRQAIAIALHRPGRRGRDRLRELEALWQYTPNAFELIKAIHTVDKNDGQVNGTDRIAQFAATFDSAAKLSPAASVALYSLGREDLLEQATAEVISYLRARALLRPNRCAPEIGCGIGRFLVALARELSRVVGLDLSPAMLVHARRRTMDCGNVELLHCNGKDFQGLPSESFDFVLAIDVFPYLVAAGNEVVRCNIEEAHRVLRLKGRLVIINFSYRGDHFDCHDVLRLSEAMAYNVRRCGVPMGWNSSSNGWTCNRNQRVELYYETRHYRRYGLGRNRLF